MHFLTVHYRYKLSHVLEEQLAHRGHLRKLHSMRRAKLMTDEVAEAAG